MFLVVNLNPAIDRIYSIPNFKIGGLYRSHLLKAQAGGKGVNVARAGKIFECSPIVMGFVGGYSGKYICKDLDENNIRYSFTLIKNENRTCMVFLDPEHATQTVINEEGPSVSQQEFQDFLVSYKECLKKYSLVVMSGSIPQEIVQDVYAILLEHVTKIEGISLVDASKQPLYHAIQASPSILKANITEIAEMTNNPEKTVQSSMDGDYKELYQYSQSLIEKGCKNVVVTLGEKGAIWFRKNQTLLAIPPAIQAVNTVGSGDAMTAGIATELVKNEITTSQRLDEFDPTPCLISGVSAGTTNATIGGIQFTKETFEKIRTQVTIKDLTGSF